MKRHAPFTRGINASPSRLKSLAGYNRLLEKQQAGDVPDSDRYGRLLRYVFANGIFVNAVLLLTGLVTLTVREPDVRYAKLLQRYDAIKEGAKRKNRRK